MMTMAAASYGPGDLVVGQRAEFETVVTAADVAAFVALSGDASPLHVDASFARRRGFPDQVVHGAHLVALVSRLAGMYLPGRNGLLLGVQTVFTAPVLPGMRLALSGVVEQLSDSVRSAVLRVRVTDVDSGLTLARGKLTVGFTREDGETIPHG